MKGENDFSPEDFDKTNPFRVPDDYFDKLPISVMNRLPRKQSRAGWVASPVFRTSLGLAAFLIMVVVGFLIFRNPAAGPDLILASGSEPDIAEYLLTQEVSSQDLIEALAQSDVQFDELPPMELPADTGLLPDETDVDSIEDFL
jgi:hypothetical protein